MPNVQNVSSGTPRVPSLPNAPANISVCTSSQSNSRQNLDSLIQAIGHLEGDHLFSEDHHQQVSSVIVNNTEKNVVNYPNESQFNMNKPSLNFRLSKKKLSTIQQHHLHQWLLLIEHLVKKQRRHQPTR